MKEPSRTSANPSTEPGGHPPRQSRSSGLLWTGVVLLVVVLAQAVAVLVNPSNPWTQGFDDAVRQIVGVGPKSHAYSWLFPMFFQHLGQPPGMISLGLAFPLLLALIGRWRTALFVLSVLLAAPGLVSQLLKNLADRPRPAADTALGLYGPLFQVDHGSFPSGHATTAGALAVILIALVPPAARSVRFGAGAVGAVLILGMIWQRTLVNAHWVSDAIAGSLAGVGVGLVMWWAFEPWLRRDYRKRPWFLPPRSHNIAP